MNQVRKQLKTQCLTDSQNLLTQTTSDNTGQDTPWTDVELLERSRYILCKMQPDWEEDEIEIMNHLFSSFPILQTAYELTQQLRQWYHRGNIGKHIISIERELFKWYDQVDQAKISAFNGVRKMIEKHQDDIINYFKEGQTNAKAENMNSKIQRFLLNNFGIKDRDFFFYRLAGYFS
jgi:transposase